MKLKFFKSQDEFEEWMKNNFSSANEIIVGFYKVNSKKKGITYKEALDIALCYGWIDGIRKSIDADSWMIRFTPRKTNSIWSNVNSKRMQELSKLGLVKQSGKAAFKKRAAHRSGIYSFEQSKIISLDPVFEKQFKKNKTAWKWFQSQAPSYKKTVSFWVMSGKKEETKLKRLKQLIADSEHGRKVAAYTWNEKKK